MLAIDGHVQRVPSIDDVKRELKMSPYGKFYLLEENLKKISQILIEKSKQTPQTKPAANESDELEPVQVEDLVFEEPVAERRDSLFEIELTADQMQAIGTITQAWGGEILGQAAIVNKIKAAGIKKGYVKEAIERLIAHEKSAPPGTALTEVIAVGEEPGEGEPSRFEYCVTPIQDRVLVPQEREDGTMDMHDLGEIETVESGDKLMMVVPAEAGKNGHNVLGEVVFAKKPKNLNFTVGEGTKVDLTDSLVLLAARPGVPLKINSGMMVSEVLIVTDVDLKMGNIEYDGDVLVKGSVTGGMKVKATGNIIVNGFVESSVLEAGRDVIVKQGIIGKELAEHAEGGEDLSARVFAGSSVTARYAQYAFLEAGESISVTTQLLHCHCVCEDEVHVGHTNQRKSKLMGGWVKVDRLLTAGVIGAPSNAKVIIDFSHPFQQLDQEIIKIKDEIEAKDELVVGLHEALAELQAQKPSPELLMHCKKIKNTIDHVTEDLRGLRSTEESKEKAKDTLFQKIQVDVYGKVFPGVEFVIGDKTFPIKDERGSCVIKFSKEKLLFN